MDRVGIVLDLVAELVCQGPSLSWAECVMSRDVPKSSDAQRCKRHKYG